MNILEFLKYHPFGYSHDVAVISAIFGTSVFLIYLIACFCNYGITKSISITYYFVKPRWLFQAFMWASIFCIGCIGQNILYFIVCFFFAIMTCNPSVNSGNIYFIPHMIGAITSITLGLIGIPITYSSELIFFPITALTSTIFIGIVSIFNSYLRQDFIYIIEIICLSQLLLGFWYGIF